MLLTVYIGRHKYRNNAQNKYLFMLFQKVICIAESVPAEGLRAALSQAFDAITEPARGRGHVLQPTVRRLRHNHLHTHGVTNL